MTLSLWSRVMLVITGNIFIGVTSVFLMWAFDIMAPDADNFIPALIAIWGIGGWMTWQFLNLGSASDDELGGVFDVQKRE